MDKYCQESYKLNFDELPLINAKILTLPTCFDRNDNRVVASQINKTVKIIKKDINSQSNYAINSQKHKINRGGDFLYG